MKRLVLAATLAAVPALAQAATVSQSFTFSGTGTSFSEALSSFAYFDLGGTLDGVTLEYSASASGTVSADACEFFGDCEPATFALNLSGNGLLAGASDSATDGSGITNGTDVNQTGSYSTDIAGMFTFGPAGFTGSGTFGGLNFTGVYSGFHVDGGSSYSGTVTLTYDYSVAAVPLPASLPLALGALGLLGLQGRRRAA